MQSDEKEQDSQALLWISVVFVGSVWLYWLLSHSDLEPNLAGDAFGSINALFTGAAFLLLIWQIRLQRQDLAMQKRELALQRLATQQVADQARKDAQAAQATLALSAWRTLLASGRELDRKVNEYADYRHQRQTGLMHEEPPVRQAFRDAIQKDLASIGRAIDDVIVMDREAQIDGHLGIWVSAAHECDATHVGTLFESLQTTTNCAVDRLHQYIPALPDID